MKEKEKRERKKERKNAYYGEKGQERQMMIYIYING